MNLLHVKSKITFPNPYVLRVEVGSAYDFNYSAHEANYNKFIRKFRRMSSGTWGFSSVAVEANQVSDSTDLFYRAYICFKDECDVLQFMLCSPFSTKKVLMWPSNRLFTIHEVVEDNSANI